MSRNPLPPHPEALDPEALEAQRARMKRLARSLVRDYDRAEDVVQETCLRALTGSVRPRRGVAACLSGVVRNVAAKLRRSEGRRDARERGAAREEGLPSTLDMLARVEEQGRVLTAVRKLAEPCRTAILLRYFEGLPPRAIAARTGAPLDTVKSRLKRGLQRLRARLDDAHGGSREGWMAALLPMAGFEMLRTASALTTGGTIVSQGAKTKAAIAAAVVLIGGAALLYGGVFENDEALQGEPAPMTAAERAPKLAGAARKPEGLETADAELPPAREEPPEASAAATQATDVTAGSTEDKTKGKPKPAVRRSPFGLPKRPPGTRFGGGGGGMGGPTGHWTRFGPGKKPSGAARIAVTVKDASGKLVEGAEVYLGPPDTVGQNGISFGDLRKLGPTNTKGLLQADALPEGEAAVFARFHGRLLTPRGLDGRHGKTTTLTGGGDVRVELELPFSVADLGTLKGRVLDPDGNPISSASVSTGFAHMWSKRDGSYVLDGLLAGPTTLAARATGFGSSAVETEVVAGKSTTADIRLEYAEGGTMRLEGRVLGPEGEPVVGANVYLMMVEDRGTLRRAKSDEEGRYVMASLPERVRTEKARLQASRIPLYDSRSITFEAGIHDTRIDLQLPVRYVQLQLKIVDAETGEPVSQLRVVATRPESRRPKAHITYDYKQGYRKGMVEAGRHRIEIDALDHEDMTLDLDVKPDADWHFSHEIKLKRVSPPSVQVALTIRLKEAGTGVAVGHAKIAIVETGNGEALSRFESRRVDGEYRMPSPSGTRKLVIEAEGYREYARTLELKPDEPEVVLDIELQPK